MSQNFQKVKLVYSSIEIDILNRKAKELGYSDFRERLRKDLIDITDRGNLKMLKNSMVDKRIIMYPMARNIITSLEPLCYNLQMPLAVAIKKFGLDHIIVNSLLSEGF